MTDAALPVREIIRITDELARYWRDHHLMDQLTVTRGYAELVQIDPANRSYQGKLNLALERLSEMAGQRGLRTTTERIRNMGIRDRSETTVSSVVSPQSELQASSAL